MMAVDLNYAVFESNITIDSPGLPHWYFSQCYEPGANAPRRAMEQINPQREEVMSTGAAGGTFDPQQALSQHVLKNFYVGGKWVKPHARADFTGNGRVLPAGP